MANECWMLLGELASSDIEEVVDARLHVYSVYMSLKDLEEVDPENVISAQLRPLFREAREVMRHHWKDENVLMGGASRVISKAMQKVKLDSVAKRLEASTSRTISYAMRTIKPEDIAEIIKASKPSRSSSSPITMEMVRFVIAMLSWRCPTVMHLVLPAVEGKLKYLQVLLKLTAELCIEHVSMKDLFTHVEDVAYTAAQVAVFKVDHCTHLEYSKVLERISPSMPEWRQIYLSVLVASKSSTSEAPPEAGALSCFLENLTEDAKGQFDGILTGLITFSGLFKDRGHIIWPLGELISHQSKMDMVALIIEAAIVIYSSYGEKIDMKRIAHLDLAFNHVNIELCLVDLLYHKATIVGLIDYVREELVLLRTLFMDALEQYKEQTRITDLLTFIQSVTRKAREDIESLSRNPFREDLSLITNLLHFQLLLKFKFFKAAIRQMCPNSISASSTVLEHPAINLANTLPINFEVIDSYLSTLKSSKPTVDEVLMGFREYILDNLQLMDKTILTFNVVNEVKKFYYGLLLLVTYLIDPLVQFIDCNKQTDISKGLGTILFFDKSRNLNLVLQFWTVAFKLIQSEGSLVDLLKHKAKMQAQILDLIEGAHEELISLKAFLAELLGQPTELNELDDFLRSVEVVAHKLAQISGSCYESFMDGGSSDKMMLLLSDYLQEIESIEARKVFFPILDASPCSMVDQALPNFLLNHQNWMLNYDACSISFLKYQIPVIKDKLVYLGSFLADIVQYRDMNQELKGLAKRVQDRNYVCLFNVGDYRPTWYYMFYLSDVKQLLRFVEGEVEMICLKVPDLSSYSFPKTNGLGFLEFFLGKMEELLHSELELISKLKSHIVLLKEGLLRLRSFFDHLEESYDEHDQTCGLITSVFEAAYKAEYVIDSCLACSHPLWYKVLWISEAVENIKLVNEVVSETCERKKTDVTLHKVTKTTYVVPSLSANTPRSNEEMVGFQEVMDQIKKQLLGGMPQLDVISLVGMPGIGKTTIAEKIYNDLIVSHHFDIHSKCRVTQVYAWRGVLLTILNDVLEPADRTGKGDGEIADELRRILMTKRFLILIDDVWDYNVWDSLRMCSRDARNGSRIILTTRLSDIANHAKCGSSNPHHLRLLRDDESWTLLQRQVFQGESYPPELGDVGFRIAKLCGGLPLFIVLVAGVLKEKKKQAVLWKEVEERLGAQNVSSLGGSMPVIGFSYKNLPDYLKPCFLYFGGLLRGKDIPVSKLTRLWLSEGFVQEPEHAAQDLLEDLISRNLVMGMKKRPNGKVKTCRIHDMLHQFCLETSKQENFFLRINRFSGEDMFPQKPKEYRLFVHSFQDQIDMWQPSPSTTRSLIFSVIDLDSLLWPRDISFIFESFKLVKVLDLESFNVGATFPTEINSLIHLRYFAFQTDANSIPSSISKLWNLETIVVRGLGGEVILPSSLLSMVKLKHILVKHRASFSLHENMGESLASSRLENLETFSTPCLSHGEDAEKILTMMPNLRKLSCIFSGTLGYSEKIKASCVLFPRLEFLSHLESLKLVSNSYPAKLQHEFNFPSKLRELTLSKFRLPWSQISAIGELPNLEILKLVLRAFEGRHWEVKDSEFLELKYLKLDNLNIEQWSLSDDAFPKLESLVLTKCERLEEIPSQFGESISLQSIDVSWCRSSAANSAKEIRTTQHEYYERYAFTVTTQSCS